MPEGLYGEDSIARLYCVIAQRCGASTNVTPGTSIPDAPRKLLEAGKFSNWRSCKKPAGVTQT